MVQSGFTWALPGNELLGPMLKLGGQLLPSEAPGTPALATSITGLSPRNLTSRFTEDLCQFLPTSEDTEDEQS